MNNPDFDINLTNSSIENQKTYFEVELNGGTRGLKGDTGDPGFSPIVDITKEGTTTKLTITDKNGVHTSNIYDGTGGDMNRSVYDINDNGIVDNAEKVNNHTVDADVPDNAVFTDTVYDDSEVRQNISTLNTIKADKSDTAYKIEASINNTTYVATFTLKNKNNEVLNTSSIDLPLESVVVNGSYDSTNKKIVLTLQSGNTIDIPVGGLISGLQSEITSSNKLSSDLVYDTNNTNLFVTSEEKGIWASKYDKPSGGIPKTDLDINVQTSLGKADSALQDHQDISGKEDKSNKVTSISSSSTDTQYPSAKCVYDIVGNIANTLDTIQREVI